MKPKETLNMIHICTKYDQLIMHIHVGILLVSSLDLEHVYVINYNDKCCYIYSILRSAIRYTSDKKLHSNSIEEGTTASPSSENRLFT